MSLLAYYNGFSSTGTVQYHGSEQIAPLNSHWFRVESNRLLKFISFVWEEGGGGLSAWLTKIIKITFLGICSGQIMGIILQ